MSKHIFISHSSRDFNTARKICSILEDNALSCWIAPRDVRPGFNYDEEILDGIEQCKAFLILISDHSNLSDHVRREIELAITNGKAVFPIRIKEVEPGRKLKFFLAGVQWVDAWQSPLESHLEGLIYILKELTNTDKSVEDLGQTKAGSASGVSKEILHKESVPLIKNQGYADENENESSIPVDPGIIEQVEIKTMQVDGSRIGEGRHSHFKNSNATAIFARYLARDCTFQNFIWLFKQAMDEVMDESTSTKHLLLALEFARRNRKTCDPVLIQNDYDNKPYIIQELVITHLGSSPLRNLLLPKIKDWVLSVKYRQLRRDLINIGKAISTKEMMEPLMDIVRLQDDCSPMALEALSGIREEQIYQLACDSLYAKSGWLIAAAARVISKYPEHSDQSISLITEANSSILSAISPEQAYKSIFRSIWILDPNKALEFVNYEREHFLTSSNMSLLSEYLNFILNININKLNFFNKTDFRHLIRIIFESGVLDNLYSRNHFESGLRKKEKELEETKR